MRKNILVLLLILLSNFIYGQAKKPTLMVLPSDNWCEQRYFMTTFDNQGTKMKVPDYKKAFQEDLEIGQVIAKIGSLLIDRGFPLKDAEQEIKNLEAQSAEDAMTSSATSGAGLAESPLDKLKKRAKADIIIQIWWSVNKATDGKSVSFTIEAFDAYTSKRIASSTGTGKPSQTELVPVMLQEAVLSNIDGFLNQLQKHFDDMFENGREIIVRVKRWESWDKNLEFEIQGKEISDYINDWMQTHTVKGRFTASDVTENFIKYEQVRIPLYDSNNNAIDARQFTKELQKYLKGAPFNFECKLMTRGLGEAIVVIGEK